MPTPAQRAYVQQLGAMMGVTEQDIDPPEFSKVQSLYQESIPHLPVYMVGKLTASLKGARALARMDQKAGRKAISMLQADIKDALKKIRADKTKWDKTAAARKTGRTLLVWYLKREKSEATEQLAALDHCEKTAQQDYDYAQALSGWQDIEKNLKRIAQIKKKAPATWFNEEDPAEDWEVVQSKAIPPQNDALVALTQTLARRLTRLAPQLQAGQAEKWRATLNTLSEAVITHPQKAEQGLQKLDAQIEKKEQETKNDRTSWIKTRDARRQIRTWLNQYQKRDPDHAAVLNQAFDTLVTVGKKGEYALALESLTAFQKHLPKVLEALRAVPRDTPTGNEAVLVQLRKEVARIAAIDPQRVKGIALPVSSYDISEETFDALRQRIETLTDQISADECWQQAGKTREALLAFAPLMGTSAKGSAPMTLLNLSDHAAQDYARIIRQDLKFHPDLDDIPTALARLGAHRPPDFAGTFALVQHLNTLLGQAKTTAHKAQELIPARKQWAKQQGQLQNVRAIAHAIRTDDPAGAQSLSQGLTRIERLVDQSFAGIVDAVPMAHHLITTAQEFYASMKLKKAIDKLFTDTYQALVEAIDTLDGEVLAPYEALSTYTARRLPDVAPDISADDLRQELDTLLRDFTQSKADTLDEMKGYADNARCALTALRSRAEDKHSALINALEGPIRTLTKTFEKNLKTLKDLPQRYTLTEQFQVACGLDHPVDRLRALREVEPYFADAMGQLEFYDSWLKARPLEVQITQDHQTLAKQNASEAADILQRLAQIKDSAEQHGLYQDAFEKLTDLAQMCQASIEKLKHYEAMQMQIAEKKTAFRKTYDAFESQQFGKLRAMLKARDQRCEGRHFGELSIRFHDILIVLNKTPTPDLAALEQAIALAHARLNALQDEIEVLATTPASAILDELVHSDLHAVMQSQDAERWQTLSPVVSATLQAMARTGIIGTDRFIARQEKIEKTLTQNGDYALALASLKGLHEEAQEHTQRHNEEVHKARSGLLDKAKQAQARAKKAQQHKDLPSALRARYQAQASALEALADDDNLESLGAAAALIEKISTDIQTTLDHSDDYARANELLQQAHELLTASKTLASHGTAIRDQLIREHKTLSQSIQEGALPPQDAQAQARDVLTRAQQAKQNARLIKKGLDDLKKPFAQTKKNLKALDGLIAKYSPQKGLYIGHLRDLYDQAKALKEEDSTLALESIRNLLTQIDNQVAVYLKGAQASTSARLSDGIMALLADQSQANQARLDQYDAQEDWQALITQMRNQSTFVKQAVTKAKGDIKALQEIERMIQTIDKATRASRDYDVGREQMRYLGRRLDHLFEDPMGAKTTSLKHLSTLNDRWKASLQHLNQDLTKLNRQIEQSLSEDDAGLKDSSRRATQAIVQLFDPRAFGDIIGRLVNEKTTTAERKRVREDGLRQVAFYQKTLAENPLLQHLAINPFAPPAFGAVRLTLRDLDLNFNRCVL